MVKDFQSHDHIQITFYLLLNHEDYKKTLYYFDLIKSMESIGDIYFRISLDCHEKKHEPSNATLESLRRAVLITKSLIAHARKFRKDNISMLLKNINQELSCFNADGIFGCNIFTILIKLYECTETIYFLNFDQFLEI